MTRMPRQNPPTEKLEALKDALENYQPGSNAIVDRRLEEALAPISAKAARLVNHRPRSEYELRQRLLQDGAQPHLVDQVIERCRNNGMLDDEVFASEWVRQRQQNQKKSVAVLRQELQRKGVASHIIETALDQVDDQAQAEILVELVNKKAGTISEVPADRKEYDKLLRRVAGVGARRGFPPTQVMQAATEALDLRIAELRQAGG